MTLYINEDTVQKNLTMLKAIELVEASFIDRANGRAFDIPRVRTRQPNGHLHILQAAAPKINVIGYKAYYIQPGKSRTSLLHLINQEQGNLEAIIESDYLSQIRTGAATGVATKYLSRPDSQVLGLFGSGRHAVTQLEAVCAVRKINEVKVFARNQERLIAFCKKMESRMGVTVRPAISPADTIKNSDIIVTMTRSPDPLFDGALLEPGQFIAATGSNALDRREVDMETVKRSNLIVVDSKEIAKTECGDLMPAYENGLIYWENIPDLGEVIIKRSSGRTKDDDIILFESHGMALQDLYTGKYLLDSASLNGFVVALPF